jgi:DNA-binding NarL/FixJ family response regulator
VTEKDLRIMDATERKTKQLFAGSFTNKESKVFEMLAVGNTNPQIAESLCMSVRTVRFHVGNILKKLKAANRTEAVVKAAQKGILDLGMRSDSD